MRPGRPLRPGRIFVILALALLAGLVADWVRRERVVFARPLPEITTGPAP